MQKPPWKSHANLSEKEDEEEEEGDLSEKKEEEEEEEGEEERKNILAVWILSASVLLDAFLAPCLFF